MAHSEKANLADAANRVVTSDDLRKRRRHTSTQWMLLVAILLVISSAIAYVIHVRDTPSVVPTSDQNTALWMIAHPEQRLEDAQKNVSKAQSPEERSTAYENLGLAYVNTDQLANAVAAYQQALSLTSSESHKVSILTEMFSAYYSSGDNMHATATLQQLVQLLQHSSDSALRAQAATYQTMIQRINAGERI